MPDLSGSYRNQIVINEKEFASTCIVLESKGHETPHNMSVMKFFEALAYWKKQVKSGGSNIRP